MHDLLHLLQRADQALGAKHRRIGRLVGGVLRFGGGFVMSRSIA